MLISCPSCPRTYRVPASAIPPEGRDVTCTACGEVWFERGLEAEVVGVGGGRATVSRPMAVKPPAASPVKKPVMSIVPPPVSDIVSRDEPAPGQVADLQNSIRTAFTDGPPPEPAAENDNPSPQDPAPTAAAGEPARSSVLLGSLARWWSTLDLGRIEDNVYDLFRPQVPREQIKPAPGQFAASRVRRRAQAQMRNRLTYPRIAGWTAWLSVVAVLVVVVGDPALMQKLWPKTSAVYGTILDSSSGSRPIELDGVTTRLAQSIDGPVLEVRGRVVNRGEAAVMPLLTLTVAGERVPHRETVSISRVVIPTGGERPFVLRANMPQGATHVGLTVADGPAPSGGEPDSGFIMQPQGSGWGWSSPPPSAAMRGTLPVTTTGTQ